MGRLLRSVLTVSALITFSWLDSAWAVSQTIKSGVYHSQGKWADENQGGFFQFTPKDTADVKSNPPQVLNIYYLQYEYQSDQAWTGSVKLAYHDNYLKPYTQKAFGIAIPIDESNENLDSHHGLEDTEIILGYKLSGTHLKLGLAMPLFLKDPSDLEGESHAWDGFRSYRLLASIDGVWLHNWWMLKSDLILAPQAHSKVDTWDGSIQLLQYYGLNLGAGFGFFTGNIWAYSAYHWAGTEDAHNKIYRQEFSWDPQLGISYKLHHWTVKTYAGMTVWGSASVRTLDARVIPADSQPNRWRAAQSPRNLSVGFETSIDL